MGLSKLGLVLTAGGARGAYQAGVLKRIGEIPRLRNLPSPFPIIAGASAGAINGATLAAGSSKFGEGTEFLAKMWENLRTEDIFRSDIPSLSSLAIILLKDLTLGGLFGGGHAQSLLDATPLYNFLSNNLPFDKIQSSIDQGHLYALAVTATNYLSGKSFIFIQGQKGHPIWEKSRRIALASKIGVEHICASSAIPVVFQPVLVKTSLGDFYFGDGGLRLTNPLSPAIRLGATKLFAIGIRHQKASEKRSSNDLVHIESNHITMRKPPLAQVTGVILNSIFLDHLDSDAEHLQRINEVAQHYRQIASSSSGLPIEPIKQVDHLVVKPSLDLGDIADSHSKKMPAIVRYFMEGLGTSKSETSDLISYLLFDHSYTRDLLETGYKDAQNRLDEIDSFIAP